MNNVTAEKENPIEKLKLVFGKNSIRTTENGFKINFQKLTSLELKEFLAFNEAYFFRIKRSGTGLVVIASEKEKFKAR